MVEAVRSVGEYIRQQRETAKYSVRQLAALAGVSNPYLSQIERGLRRPSAEILQQLAKALRISAEALYVQAGILEERVDGDVPDAIRHDPRLDERQRATLLEVYEAFLRENAVLAAAEDDVSPEDEASLRAEDPASAQGDANANPTSDQDDTDPTSEDVPLPAGSAPADTP